MEFFRTERFRKDFKRLPAIIQENVPEVLERLATNRRHPSLQVKKMEGVQDIWELCVTQNYRITFQCVREGVLLWRIGTHDVLRQP